MDRFGWDLGRSTHRKRSRGGAEKHSAGSQVGLACKPIIINKNVYHTVTKTKVRNSGGGVSQTGEARPHPQGVAGQSKRGFWVWMRGSNSDKESVYIYIYACVCVCVCVCVF